MEKPISSSNPIMESIKNTIKTTKVDNVEQNSQVIEAVITKSSKTSEVYEVIIKSSTGPRVVQIVNDKVANKTFINQVTVVDNKPTPAPITQVVSNSMTGDKQTVTTDQNVIKNNPTTQVSFQTVIQQNPSVTNHKIVKTETVEFGNTTETTIILTNNNQQFIQYTTISTNVSGTPAVSILGSRPIVIDLTIPQSIQTVTSNPAPLVTPVMISKFNYATVSATMPVLVNVTKSVLGTYPQLNKNSTPESVEIRDAGSNTIYNMVIGGQQFVSVFNKDTKTVKQIDTSPVPTKVEQITFTTTTT